MTDTEGTEARRSDGEETQFIQPIRDYGRAETKPVSYTHLRAHET